MPVQWISGLSDIEGLPLPRIKLSLLFQLDSDACVVGIMSTLPHPQGTTFGILQQVRRYKHQQNGHEVFSLERKILSEWVSSAIMDLCCYIIVQSLKNKGWKEKTNSKSCFLTPKHKLCLSYTCMHIHVLSHTHIYTCIK